MTLDDIEKQARAIEDRRTGSLTFEVTTDLARAVLAMLPVVRAAASYVDGLREDCQPTALRFSKNWNKSGIGDAAIDEMRRAMEGK